LIDLPAESIAEKATYFVLHQGQPAQMRQAQADTPLHRMPLVVLSHSKTLPNPFGFPPDWPIEALDRAFQHSQDKLAKLVPGARHVIAAKSGHYIQLDQPRLVPARSTGWCERYAAAEGRQVAPDNVSRTVSRTR
jgi:hypothetical protein